MKPGRPLDELAREIMRQAETKKDFLAPSQQLRMNASPLQLTVGEQGAFDVKPVAHQQIGDRLGIPKRYYDKCLADSPGLLADNVNHWLAKRKESRLVRCLDGNVRAFLSDSYRPLDNFDLAEAVFPALKEVQAEVISADVTDTRFYIKAVTPRLEGEVRVGDTVQGGLAIFNSEVGLGSLRIEHLLYRLVCLNGMIAAKLLRKTHVGQAHRGLDELSNAVEHWQTDTQRASQTAFWLQVRDTIKASLSQESFDDLLSRVRGAADDPIQINPIKAVELLAKQHTLSDEEQGGVLRHLMTNGDMTRWGLTNAITRTSQDVESYDRATELEVLGGKIIELPRTEWDRIAA